MGKVNDALKSARAKDLENEMRKRGGVGARAAEKDMPEAYYTNHDPNAGAPTEQEKKDMEERRKAAEAAAAQYEEENKPKKSSARVALGK